MSHGEASGMYPGGIVALGGLQAEEGQDLIQAFTGALWQGCIEGRLLRGKGGCWGDL